jgi:periplasmic protein TonB
MKAFARNILLASMVGSLVSIAVLHAQESQDTTSETVYELGKGIKAPKATYAPNPTYVDRARREKINGTVVLSLIVTAEGKVRDVKVTKSLDPDLDKQAIAAVRTWRFEPGAKDGKAVGVRLNVETTFRLY